MTNKSIHSKLYHRIIARLRAKREEKGLSQYQLSQILNVPQPYVSRIETYEYLRSSGYIPYRFRTRDR